MTLLINPQNNNPTPFFLTDAIPESARTLSSTEDFISKAIDIVKTSAQKGNFDHISVPLQALRAEYPMEVISPETCHALVEKCKNSGLFTPYLPMIYRHLILDLQLRTDDFSTYNEEFRIAIAKLALQQEDPLLLCKTIKNYGIKSEEARVEIAKLAAQQDGGATSEYISNYGIESEEARVEIAKLAAQQDGATSEYISNYGIESEETRVEIAKLAAQKSGMRVSQYISKYNIKSEETRVEIAKLAAQQDGGATSEYISNYGIESEEARVEIATLAAQQDGGGVSRYISNYGIKSEKARVEIATLAAQQNGWAVSEYISNYGIKSEETHVEIAKLAAQKSGMMVSEYISNYGIKSEEARVEIAKLAAQQDGWAVSQYISKYNIKSEEARVEIAKLAAQQDGGRVSIYISNYGIKSEEARVEIAKRAAQQDGRGVSEYISNYDIKSEEARVEIAKRAAQQNGRGVSEYISNYGIKSEEARVEIAKLATEQLLAQDTNLDILDTLQRYNLSIKNRVFLILSIKNRGCLIARLVSIIPEIAHHIKTSVSKTAQKTILEILEQYPELRIFGINDSSFSEFCSLFEIDKVPDVYSEKRKALYQEMVQETNPDLKAAKLNSLRIFCSILDFADGSPSLLEKFCILFTSMQQEKDAYVQKQKLHSLAALLMHCRTKNVDKRALDEHFFLLNEVFAIQDPPLRSYLIPVFIENITHPALRGFIRENLSSVTPKKNHYLTANLALLLLAPLITNMIPYVELSFTANKTRVSENEPEIRYVSFIKRMQELLNHSYFQKDRLKAQSLLRSLRTLVDTDQLSHAQKTSILRDLIFIGHLVSIQGKYFSKNDQCAELLRYAETVSLLIHCGQSDHLPSITVEQLQEELVKAFASILKISVPDNSLILNTLTKWRNPRALLIYAGTLQSCDETREKALPLLQQFAKSVFNGTFAFDRYDSSSSNASEHWLKICEHNPLLVEKWKKGNSYREKMFDVVDTDDPCDLLLSGTEVGSCQRVDGDPSKSKCLVAYLMDPKIRMMAVKNTNGVIVARCMLRLLWDKKTEKFVLFQEEKYPIKIETPLFADMLDQACKKRAEELGVALLVKAEDGEQNNMTTLQAFKGKAPFEYVDALLEYEDAPSAITTDAGFEISQCKYIYQP